MHASPPPSPPKVASWLYEREILYSSDRMHRADLTLVVVLGVGCWVARRGSTSSSV